MVRHGDMFAIEHPQVAQAIKAIREHYQDPMTADGITTRVPMFLRLHDAIIRHIGRSETDEVT